MTRDDDPMFEANRAHVSRVRRASPSDPPHILIVDDDPSVRAFVERAVREAGYTTAVAASGPEALATAAGAGPFDLLLTDVVMPEMHGSELARRLRQEDPDLKVLYLTGYSDQLFKEKPMWTGEAFLDKPCTVTGLREAVALLLYGHLRPPGVT